MGTFRLIIEAKNAEDSADYVLDEIYQLLENILINDEVLIDFASNRIDIIGEHEDAR